jgi:hypothetical protein
MRHLLKQVYVLGLALLPFSAMCTPTSGSQGISLIPTSVDSKLSPDVFAESPTSLLAHFGETQQELKSGGIGDAETGLLTNFLAPTIGHAPGFLLIDTRVSNPVFATDVTMAADLSRLYKTPFGYYADQKIADMEKAKLTDDGGAMYLGIAVALVAAAALTYLRALRNRKKIRQAIHLLRQKNGVRRRRSSRKSRTVVRR